MGKHSPWCLEVALWASCIAKQARKDLVPYQKLSTIWPKEQNSRTESPMGRRVILQSCTNKIRLLWQNKSQNALCRIATFHTSILETWCYCFCQTMYCRSSMGVSSSWKFLDIQSTSSSHIWTRGGVWRGYQVYQRPPSTTLWGYFWNTKKAMSNRGSCLAQMTQSHVINETFKSKILNAPCQTNIILLKAFPCPETTI